MSDKPVDALATLGTIIDGSQGRDAIHLAVIPIRAASPLVPATDVGVHKGLASATARPLVGIVDPFLNDIVQPGQWFWLVLYPRTITSLRHAWTHPAFDDEPAQRALTSRGLSFDRIEPPNIAAMQQQNIAEAANQRQQRQRSESEAWMRNFVATHDCPNYETLLAAAVNHDDTYGDDYLVIRDHDAHGEIPNEFWDHIEVLTGRQIQKRPTYFSCSC